MSAIISKREKEINAAIAAEFRVLRARRGWGNKAIAQIFKKHGLEVNDLQRIQALATGKRRLYGAELIILLAYGLNVSDIVADVKKINSKDNLLM
jgi:hypothetical protein